jgi:hypothetical protein
MIMMELNQPDLSFEFRETMRINEQSKERILAY